MARVSKSEAVVVFVYYY